MDVDGQGVWARNQIFNIVKLCLAVFLEGLKCERFHFAERCIALQVEITALFMGKNEGAVSEKQRLRIQFIELALL